MAELSQRDQEILVHAWKCFKAPPEVDYEKLRELGGYKTTASATACYCPVKNKFLGKSSAKMTARDREILIMAWKCFKSVPQVDYKKLQEAAGYKTVASATACYCGVKNKLLGTNAEIKASSKRKRAAKNGEQGPPAPKKRGKKVTNKTKGEETPPHLEKHTKSGYATPDTDDGPHHRLEPSAEPDQDSEKPVSIKNEPQHDFVDGGLFAGAAQLLNDQESDDDVLS